MDIKEIKSAVEEVVKEPMRKWEESRSADKAEFDTKMSAAIDKVAAEAKEREEKTAKELQDNFDQLAAKVTANGGQGNKIVTVRQAIHEGIKHYQAEIVEKASKNKLDTIIDLKQFNYTDFTGYEEHVTDFSRPAVFNPYDSFHWRDIVPLGSTMANTIQYPKEGATTGAADTWEHAGDEATSKPEISPSLTTDSQTVQWIAGLIKGIPISMLEDLPWLTSYLQNKAMNELMKAEDLQIKEGSGVDPDLDGFFTGTNATAYDGSKTIFVEILIDAAYRQVADAFYQANKAVISNADKVDILLMEKSTGSGYGVPGGTVSIVNGTLNIAGLSIYSSPAMDVGEALIGDFNQSQFVIRSAPRLRFFEQNATDAEKNQIMVRVEERAALAIFASLAFVKVVPGT